MRKSDDEISKIIHDNIQCLILSRGILISDLEKAIDVSVGYFSRRCGMKATTLVKVARYFNVSLDDLVNKNYRANFLREEIETLKKELAKIEKEK